MTPAIERFLVKISVSGINFYNNIPCWEWTASKNKDGYGNFSLKGKPISSHRFIYEYYYGSICPDLTIDHLCRNRACVNIKHLEQIPLKENLHRSPLTSSSINARKTHCKRGHEYTEENTYISLQGGRLCKYCWKLKNRKLIK